MRPKGAINHRQEGAHDRDQPGPQVEGVLPIDIYDITRKVREARSLKEKAEERLLFADDVKRDAGQRLALVYDNPHHTAAEVNQAVRELSRAIIVHADALTVANRARQLFRQYRNEQVRQQEAATFPDGQ